MKDIKNERYKYSYQDVTLKIEGVELTKYEIRNMNMEYQANNHTIFNIEFENLHENQVKYLAFKNSRYPKIEVMVNKVTEGQNFQTLIFSGEIVDFGIGNYEDGGKMIQLTALSYSVLMDRELKYRAFQDSSLTLKEIVEKVIADYKDIRFIINNEFEKHRIGKPIIQYNETDWEFIQRVASYIGMAIYPHSSKGIYVGLNSGANQEKKISVKDYAWRLRKNDYNEINYTIKSDYLLLLADEVHMEVDEESKGYIVGDIAKGILNISDGVIMTDVEIVQNYFKFPYIPNRKIVGNVIEGKVVSVLNDDGIAKMQVDLSEGLKRIANISYGLKGLKKVFYYDNGKKRYNFPYATPYSVTNTGLFCTPEKDDRVAVYFPTEEEEQGYVMSAINNTNSGRFSNPNIRNYTLKDENKNESIFSFNINSDSLVVTNNQINMFTKMEYLVNSSKEMHLISGESLEINSKTNVDLMTEKFRVQTINQEISYDNKSEVGKSSTKSLENFMVKTDVSKIGK